MTYVMRNADRYLAGYGEGTVIAPPAGIEVFEMEETLDELRALALALPGWGGDPRMVIIGDDGLPAAYTPRSLTPAEHKADALQAALTAWRAGALRDKTPAQIFALVQGRVDGWTSLANAKADLREWLPLLAVGLAWLARVDE